MRCRVESRSYRKAIGASDCPRKKASSIWVVVVGVHGRRGWVLGDSHFLLRDLGRLLGLRHQTTAPQHPPDDGVPAVPLFSLLLAAGGTRHSCGTPVHVYHFCCILPLLHPSLYNSCVPGLM